MEFIAELAKSYHILGLEGLQAPLFSWIAAIVLFVWPFIELVRLMYHSRRIRNDIKTAIKGINNLESEQNIHPGEGMSLAIYDKLNNIINSIPSLTSAWFNYKSKFVRHPNLQREDTFWSFSSAINSFNEEVIIDSQLNRRYFTAIPGIVTGLGLLATFTAILIALFGVHIDPQGKIAGINELINGLSGKFVSSVSALLAAMIYLIFESQIFHNLKMRILGFTHSIDNLVPLLTAGQVAADIKNDMTEQSNAFRLFNADLSLKLKNSMSESIGPILERMAISVDELNRLIKETETKKEESMTGQIRLLLENLEKSMTLSLEKIGDTFSNSISGSAKNQFDKMADSLGNTALFLESMNKQFVSYQASINDLINHAKNTTSEQMSLGYTQIQELANVISKSIEQLSQTTDELSSRMATTIEESARQSTSSTGAMIEKVGEMSTKNADRLEQLLERHKGELDRVSDIDASLTISLEDFQKTITAYGQVTNDLQLVTKDVNIFVSSMSIISKEMKDGQDAMQKVAAYTSSQIENLKGATQEQKEAWKIIQSSMGKYQETFAKVEGHARLILEQIAKNMNSYSSLTKDHMDKIIGVADNMMSTAVGRLSGSIDELQEQLEVLNDTVDKIVKSLARISR